MSGATDGEAVRWRSSMSGEEKYGPRVMALLAKARPRVARQPVTLAQLQQRPNEDPHALQVDIRLRAKLCLLVQRPLQQDDQ